MNLALVVAPLALLVRPFIPGPLVAAGRDARVVHMDASWRPKTVDPLGKAWGVPAKIERSYSLWLDLRTSEVTFAQQALVQLFYAVRRVVDEAGKSLPAGARVEGLLFDERRYERADTIGSDQPIFLEALSGGFVNATVKDAADPMRCELRAPLTSDELSAAQVELEELSEPGVTTVLALPADAMLWAEALTGLKPSQLECVEEGA